MIREGGLKDPFTPTMVVAGNDDGLFVFDEAGAYTEKYAWACATCTTAWRIRPAAASAVSRRV